MKRKGMMTGSGKSGYFNVIGKDPKVHSDSAMGRKQPQMTSDIDTFMARMEQGKQKKMQPEGFKEVFNAKPKPNPKKEPEVTEIKASGDPDKKPSAFWSAFGKAGAFARKEAKFGYEKGKAYLAEQERLKKERHIEELKDIQHPDVAQFDSAKDKVASLEKQIELNEEPEREEKLFRELDIAKTQQLTAEEKLKNLNLQTLSNEQLKTLAIRQNDSDSFFSIDSKNKYEREILRRIRARKQLDADISAEEKKPLGKSDSVFGSFFNPKGDEKK